MSLVYYVYALYDEAGIPRWIGAGSGKRWMLSEHDISRNPAKAAFVRETREILGYVPRVKLCENLSRERSFELEESLIESIGRQPNGPLTNIRPGGKGFHEGEIYSDERNARISAALTGREITPEWREKIAASLTGHTQKRETVEKRRAKQTGQKRTPEQRARISAALKRKKKSPEHVAAIQVAAAARPSRKGISIPEGVKAKISEGQKRAWAENPTPRVERGEDGRFTS